MSRYIIGLFRQVSTLYVINLCLKYFYSLVCGGCSLLAGFRVRLPRLVSLTNFNVFESRLKHARFFPNSNPNHTITYTNYKGMQLMIKLQNLTSAVARQPSNIIATTLIRWGGGGEGVYN